jgi:elongation factor 3
MLLRVMVLTFQVSRCHLQETWWHSFFQRPRGYIYTSSLIKNLIIAKNFEVPEWDKLAPYLAFLTSSPEPITVAREWVVRFANEGADDGEDPDDEEEGEDLSSCQFYLAYRAKVLLNTATLRLKRGRRYGLCGKKGIGKSTLMRAIHWLS